MTNSASTWAQAQYDELSKDEKKLVDAAWIAAEASYSPYSRFRVGSAIEAQNAAGEKIVFTGCNVEVASYAGTICAERTAAVKAVSAGYRKFLRASLVTATRPGGSPCGLCRQVLREFGGTEMELLIIQNEKNEIRRTNMSELLPGSFGPEDLG